MAIKKEKGFVLALYPYKETSSIITILTEKEGIKRGIAKGIGRKGAKTKDLLSQFSEVEFNFYEGEKGGLITITEAEILNSLTLHIIESPCPFILTYIAEILMETVPENQGNENIYKLTKHIIDGFMKKIPWQVLKVYFDFWMIKLNGIFPSRFLCKCKKEARYFDEEKGDFFCEEHKGKGMEFPENFNDFLKILKEKKLSEIPNFKEEMKNYTFANLIFNNILKNFIQKEIKSYNYLKTCDKLFIL